MLQSSTPCLTGTSIDRFAKRQPTHLENYSKSRCKPLFYSPSVKAHSTRCPFNSPRSRSSLIESPTSLNQGCPANHSSFEKPYQISVFNFKRASKSTSILNESEWILSNKKSKHLSSRHTFVYPLYSDCMVFHCIWFHPFFIFLPSFMSREK